MADPELEQASVTLTTRVKMAPPASQMSSLFSAGKADTNVTNSTYEGTMLMYDPEEPETDADGTPIVYNDPTGMQLDSAKLARMRPLGVANRTGISSHSHADNLIGAQVSGARTILNTGPDSLNFGQKYEVGFPDPKDIPAAWRPVDRTRAQAQARVARGKAVAHVKPYTDGEGFEKSFIGVDSANVSERGKNISEQVALMGAEFIDQMLLRNPALATAFDNNPAPIVDSAINQASIAAADARRARVRAESKSIVETLKNKRIGQPGAPVSLKRRALHFRTMLKRLALTYRLADRSVGTVLSSGHTGDYLYATFGL